jgi:ABC-type cobalamin/Fe3+-siderophores transport system ATPase subunit
MTALNPVPDLAADPGRSSRLVAEAVSLGYGDRTVVDALSVAVPDAAVTVIVGANACGKSTLLRGMARLLKPTAGAVLLDGEAIHRRRASPWSTWSAAAGTPTRAPSDAGVPPTRTPWSRRWR